MTSSHSLSRRSLLQGAGSLGALGLLGVVTSSARSPQPSSPPKKIPLTFVPFQPVFDAALKAAPAEFWLWDGIHPSPPGHALMLQTWRDAVGI